MKNKFIKFYLPAFVGLLALAVIPLASCTSSSSSSQPEYYNAGNADFSMTGTQFDQYELISFDTSTSALTLALPSAADIIDNLSSPYVGEVLTLAVANEGTNTVTIIPGTNVTLSVSASTVAPNTTLTLYAEFDNVTSGSEETTIY
jgi:hypothetical protein